jgi:hypothetical protein
VLGFSYLACLFFLARPFIWYHALDPLTFDLGVWPSFRKLNLGHTFWLVSARAFIFHMCIPSGLSFDTMTLNYWSLTFFSKTLTLVINTCKTHFLNALLHWNFWWDKWNSASFETLGALSDLVSLLVVFALMFFSYLYIDNVLSINNSQFHPYVDSIYLNELEIKDTTEYSTSAS